MDTYSFTAAGSPWINFEWLSEVPYYLGVQVRRTAGACWRYISSCWSLIYIGVYYRSCRAGADCKDAAIATLGAICLGGVSMAPRMLLFGWLCMMGCCWCWTISSEPASGLWLLPPLFAAVDQPARLLGLRLGRAGATIAAGLVEGEWGWWWRDAGRTPRAEEAAAGLGRFAGCALRQSLRLQAGAVPVRSSFPPARRNAVHRGVAAGGLQHQEWQAGAWS